MDEAEEKVVAMLPLFPLLLRAKMALGLEEEEARVGL
jgi:hypothetical protein